jgi:hypothetical protein
VGSNKKLHGFRQLVEPPRNAKVRHHSGHSLTTATRMATLSRVVLALGRPPTSRKLADTHDEVAGHTPVRGSCKQELLAEPVVLEAPAIEQAVDHDCDPVHRP